MTINEISRSMKRGEISMVEGFRGKGPETLFVIKDVFKKRTLDTGSNTIDFISCVFENSKAKPALILLKIDNDDGMVYNLWLDVCDNVHRNLLFNLTQQNETPFVLTNLNDEVIKSFEINNSMKTNSEMLLNSNLAVDWDKPTFYDAVNKIFEKHNTPEKLWSVVTTPRSSASNIIYQ